MLKGSAGNFKSWQENLKKGSVVCYVYLREFCFPRRFNDYSDVPDSKTNHVKVIILPETSHYIEINMQKNIPAH